MPTMESIEEPARYVRAGDTVDGVRLEVLLPAEGFIREHFIGAPLPVTVRMTNHRDETVYHRTFRGRPERDVRPRVARPEGEPVELTREGESKLGHAVQLSATRVPLRPGQTNAWVMDLNRLFRIPPGDNELSVSITVASTLVPGEGETHLSVEGVPFTLERHPESRRAQMQPADRGVDF